MTVPHRGDDAMDETTASNSNNDNNATKTATTEVQIPSIVGAPDICGVTFSRILKILRNTVLKDALLQCWRNNPEKLYGVMYDSH